MCFQQNNFSSSSRAQNKYLKLVDHLVTLLHIVNDSLIENVQYIFPTKLECVQSYTEMGQTMECDR